MPDRCKLILDVELSAEVPECSIIELLIIVSNNGIGNPESINNGFLEEFFYLVLGNVHQGFYLHLFSEVVNGDN